MKQLSFPFMTEPEWGEPVQGEQGWLSLNSENTESLLWLTTKFKSVTLAGEVDGKTIFFSVTPST